ncbi:MAG: aminoacyl-tRNA hydrolase, partial [SAR202 cluster bacterium]|nr:aminoacyl-tRNA hydrolase [SAR202 cluster bacterium]
MKIIVGLGNPGPKYLNTRHNIGFSIIDAFANQITIEKKERKAKCIMQFGDHNDTDIVLVKPRTFINNSGIAIKYLIDRYQIELSDLLVVYDDIALPVGKIRVRINGSSGGHNGIKSIIEATNGHIFPRLRIGV